MFYFRFRFKLESLMLLNECTLIFIHSLGNIKTDSISSSPDSDTEKRLSELWTTEGTMTFSLLSKNK